MAVTIHDILLKYQPTIFRLGMQLGLYKGSELPDPDHLLTGTGKVHRYVEINTPDLIISPALNALISAAVAACKQRIA